MKEVKLTNDNYVKILQEALEILRDGGVVIYPTETSYGLGCDYYNAEAVGKVYKIKQRDKNKPLSVLVPDLISASSLVQFSDKARRLALEYWPGPLTLVLPFNHSDWKEHFSDYLALRVSNHPFANSLTINLGHPIVATSANISDEANCYTPEEIKKYFSTGELAPDLFINAGELPKCLASTIIKFKDGKGKILRQGELKIKL